MTASTDTAGAGMATYTCSICGMAMTPVGGDDETPPDYVLACKCHDVPIAGARMPAMLRERCSCIYTPEEGPPTVPCDRRRAADLIESLQSQLREAQARVATMCEAFKTSSTDEENSLRSQLRDCKEDLTAQTNSREWWARRWETKNLELSAAHAVIEEQKRVMQEAHDAIGQFRAMSARDHLRAWLDANKAQP